ncbi:MAG: GNAT family N-acetyltransferase [Gemmatimonadaceae bacterium]
MTVVTRTYLELPAPNSLRPVVVEDTAVTVDRARTMTPSAYRQLYRDVGRAFHWRDRDLWSDAELGAYLARPETHVFVLRYGGETAGYFELAEQQSNAVEIVYFGLLARFFGRRLGAHMLTVAAREAYALGATRVWLHTCTLDSPAALPNYLARGFVETRREQYTVPPDADAFTAPVSGRS